MTKDKMMKASALALAAILGVPQAAEARSTMASAGRPASEVGLCFPLKSSAVKNECPEWRAFDIPLTIDREGDHSAFVAAHGSTVSDVSCRLVTADDRGQVWDIGEFRQISELPPFRNQIRLDDPAARASVPSYGAAFVGCWVAPGAYVRQVTYW